MNRSANKALNDELRILKSHPLFVAVHKPPGLAFQRVGDDPGVLELLREMEQDGRLESGRRLFPVHRLDKVTSGILLFARGRKAANELGNHFRFGRVEKIYAALSDRRPKKKQGQIKGDMERGRRGAWILLRSERNPAITFFKSFAIPERRPGLRLFVVRPKTGKTHQIRVALKSIGAPILGDGLYGRFDLAREEDRAYLHAPALRFRIAEECFTIHDPPAPGEEFLSPAFLKTWNAIQEPLDLF